MPLVLLFIGTLFMTAALRGTHKDLFEVLKDDFSGQDNFFIWGIAFFVIGAVGYFKPAKPFSDAFMLLVILVIFLSNDGFFNRFMAQVRG